MEAHAVWTGQHETELDDGRGHRVVVDLPLDENGADHGTSALELTALSLAGCITTIFGLIASRRRLAFQGLRVDLVAVRPPGTPTIQSVQGDAEVLSDALEEEISTVLRLTMSTCPVGVLFERAHIPVEIRLNVIRSAAVASGGPPARSP